MAPKAQWSAPAPEGPLAAGSGAAGGPCARRKNVPVHSVSHVQSGAKDRRSSTNASLEARAPARAENVAGIGAALDRIGSGPSIARGRGRKGVWALGAWAAAQGTRARHAWLWPGAQDTRDGLLCRATSVSSPALDKSSLKGSSTSQAPRSRAALRSAQSNSSTEWADLLHRLDAGAAEDSAPDLKSHAQNTDPSNEQPAALSRAAGLTNRGPTSREVESHAEGRAARMVLVLLDLPETLLPEKVRVLVGDEGQPVQQRGRRSSRRRRQSPVQPDGDTSAGDLAAGDKERAEHLGGRLAGESEDAKPDSMAARLEVFRDFGFSVDDVRQLVRCRPVVLRRSAAFVRAKMQYLIDLGVSREALPRVSRNSNWARFDPKEELPAKIAYLESVGVHNAGALLERCPRLLTLSLPRFLENEAILRDALGPDLFLALVLRNPKAFVFPRDTLVSLLHLLACGFGFTAEDLQSVLCRLTLMPCGSEELLRERLAALAEAVGESGVLEAIKKFPGLLCSSPENIREVTYGLRMLLSEADVRGAAQRDPQVLAYNWQRKLKPVIEFCGKELGLTPGEVLWSYAYIRSLEKAVAPRIMFLKAAGVRVYVGDGRRRSTDESTGKGEGHEERISLRAVANFSSAQFRERYPMYAGD